MITTMLVTICHHTKLEFCVCVNNEHFQDILFQLFTNMHCNIIIMYTTLYITSPWLMYFITGSLYLFTSFTHFVPHQNLPLWQASIHSTSLTLFCLFGLVFRFYTREIIQYLSFSALFPYHNSLGPSIHVSISCKTSFFMA